MTWETTAGCDVGSMAKTLAVLCTLTVTMMCNYFGFGPNISDGRTSVTITVQRERIEARRVKNILLWNPLYKDILYGLSSSGRKAFLNAKCPVNHCAVTTDRAVLRNASAVVFHLVGERENQLPAYRPNNQLYIHFIWESPANRILKYIDDVMNVTVSYRRDSDIFRPYQYPVKLDKVKPYKLKFSIENKTKSVLGMISHCHTVIGREDYIRELRKYIDVDIWGACGEDKCPIKRMKQCIAEVAKTYHFYLSFENSFCVDYVTEKLRRALSMDMIPLVLGGTNYTRDSPPHSVINVLDYKSPEHLARYLRYLLKNKSAYMEYFKWKQTHKMVGVNNAKIFCELCEILHNDTFSKRYVHFKKWWSDDKCNNNITDKYLVR